MLRITLVEAATNISEIRLEGKLLGPWIGELQAACELLHARQAHFRVDLSAVSYVDLQGLHLLRKLSASGAQLVRCSRFVATLLAQGK